MCGIGGCVLTDGTLELIGDLHVANIARSLALDLEHRGQDATGVARISRRGRLKVVKDHKEAKRFLKDHKGVGHGAKTLLVHTRAKTQGSQYKNDNNHPIQWGPVVGVHNGWINNDDVMFRDFGWKRNAEVDSEALFAAIAMLGAKKALEVIEGTAAVGWIDELDQYAMHVARQRWSPLHFAVSARGDFVFASEAQAVKNVLDMLPILQGVEHGKIVEAPEGTIYSVRPDGTYDFSTFESKEPRWNSVHTGGTRVLRQGSWNDLDGWAAEGTNALPLPSTFNPDGIKVDDAVWYMPIDKNYECLFGIVKKVGWRSAEVKVWIDKDVTVVVPLQLDRLYLDADDALDPTPEAQAARAIEIIEAVEQLALTEGSSDARIG